MDMFNHSRSILNRSFTHHSFNILILHLQLQYTYDFCRNGVYQSELGLLEDEHLHNDIGITNGIHRKMLLQAIREKECNTLAEERGDSESGQRFVKNIDVFISYR